MFLERVIAGSEKEEKFLQMMGEGFVDGHGHCVHRLLIRYHRRYKPLTYTQFRTVQCYPKSFGDMVVLYGDSCFS